MRLDRIVGLGVALVIGGVAPTRGDEPSKPTATATEANPAAPAAGHSVHGEAFDAGPRTAATLIPGMGKTPFPVTHASPEAQAFIDQGVAQLHSFFYFEAERSFRQAAKLSPACPMAYWGMAMANVNNAKRAKGFFKEAKKKAEASKLSRREQLYVDALDALYAEAGDEKTRKKNHLFGLEAVLAEFPGDLDARAWLAMVTWQNAGSDGIGSRQAIDLMIESILEREPLHPGAHHYRIHLWDHVKVARAEKAAAAYASSAPGIAHAWHMPGHTYTELRRYADAAYQQEGSARVDHAYMIRDRVMPFEIHNYFHNNQWLATSLGNVGRARDAIAVARNLVEQPRDPQKNGPNDGGSGQRSGRQRWAEALVKFELWNDLIAATESGALDWSNTGPERVERHRTLGLAYAALGDKARLAERLAKLKAIEPSGPRRNPTPPPAPTPAPATATTAAASPTPAPAAGTPPGPRGGGMNSSESAVAELEGYVKLLDGDVAAAFEQFAKVPTMRPEALARAHLKARNFGFAATTARSAVTKQPDQFAPMAALVEVLAACGQDEEARAAYLKLEPMLRHADRDLPVLARIRPIVDGWRESGRLAAPASEPSADDARVPLEPLGPLLWAPSPAPAIALPDTDGKPWNLADHKGRNVLVLFYLGGKCAHCMQQLREVGAEVDALRKAGTDVVAIGTDTDESARELKGNSDGIKFPMPFLADPNLDLFRAYRAHDDFEDSPMHGTFLIDAEGNIRFARVSAEPFTDVDFLKKEAERVKNLAR
ncbi:redoxin domain-containing protein [Tundrisphaera sp. TA3]|uniref:redoxin domain-containing protein n=1 Tax=Tundrisphaera sp. TA3 TaxID=3435775 RepID=UPI003EBFE832